MEHFLLYFVAILVSANAAAIQHESNYIEPKNLLPEGKMPVVGLGTWKSNGAEVETAVDAALEAGYRHIDTAEVYGNEDMIGKVLKKWLDSGKLKREELFVVTKLPPYGNRASDVEKYLSESLKALQLDYVDLYLIHVPWSITKEKTLDKSTDILATWKEMEKQVNVGKTKAIGVSNFNITQIQRVLDNSKIKPAVLQVELHAYHQQKPLVEFCHKNGIAVTAYSPLGTPAYAKNKDFDILHNPEIVEIGKHHNKSSAQVVLRHAIQKGLIVIPKSVHSERIQQNINVFDFKLSEEEMKQLNNLDRGVKGRIIDFTNVAGIKEHPEYSFRD